MNKVYLVFGEHLSFRERLQSLVLIGMYPTRDQAVNRVDDLDDYAVYDNYFIRMVEVGTDGADLKLELLLD